MARDGNGNYSNPYPDFIASTVISSTEVDANNSDIATALTQSIAVDGQSVVTADLPMAGNKHTVVGAGTALTDYADVKSVQNGTYTYLGTAGGTINALTFSPSPAITAYVLGQRFSFKVGASASDDAVTIVISGLSAVAAEINDAALTSFVTLEANKYYAAFYDGTAFKLSKLSEAAIVQATVNLSGISELATTAETETGTDTTRCVTPDGLHDMTTLAGAAWMLDEDNMVSDSDTLVATQKSIKAYVDAAIAALPAPTAGPGKVLLGSVSASASATVSFVDGVSGIVFDGTYDKYEIDLVGVVPATDGVDLRMRVTTSGTIQSGATDYEIAADSIASDAGTGTEVSVGVSFISLNESSIRIGNASGESINAKVEVFDAAAARFTHVQFVASYMDNASTSHFRHSRGAGVYNAAAAATDGIAFYMSTGNINGEFHLYGIKK